MCDIFAQLRQIAIRQGQVFVYFGVILKVKSFIIGALLICDNGILHEVEESFCVDLRRDAAHQVGFALRFKGFDWVLNCLIKTIMFKIIYKANAVNVHPIFTVELVSGIDSVKIFVDD